VKLRSHLLVLSIATAAPIVALATVIAVVVVKQERDSVRDAAGERVLAVMSAIDAELRGSIATLRAMAASAHLETGNLKAFHSDAMRIFATHRATASACSTRPTRRARISARSRTATASISPCNGASR
jgi:sensor domain CHASE-containing protein